MTKEAFQQGKKFTIQDDQDKDVYFFRPDSDVPNCGIIVTQHGRYKAAVISFSAGGFTFHANVLSRRMEGFVRFNELTTAQP